jgi:hypothetical protein
LHPSHVIFSSWFHGSCHLLILVNCDAKLYGRFRMVFTPEKRGRQGRGSLTSSLDVPPSARWIRVAWFILGLHHIFFLCRRPINLGYKRIGLNQTCWGAEIEVNGQMPSLQLTNPYHLPGSWMTDVSSSLRWYRLQYVIDWPERYEDHSKMVYTGSWETADEGKTRQGDAAGIYLESTRAIRPRNYQAAWEFQNVWEVVSSGGVESGVGVRQRRLSGCMGKRRDTPRAVHGFETSFRKWGEPFRVWLVVCLQSR